MANVGLEQGILMHKGERLRLPSTLDMTHLAEIEAPKKYTDFGTIDLWARKRKADVPFLSIAGIGSNNIIYEDDWITYDVPAMRDGSTVITADISGDAAAGRGKTPFEIQAKGAMLSFGMTFKFDLQMKDEFIVTDYRELGDGEFVYTVKRTDSDEPVNKLWLQAGNKLLPMVSFMSEEFGQEFADWQIDISGGPKYKIPVGQKTIQCHYQVTTKVAQIDRFKVTGATKKAMDDAFEYYFKIPGLDDSGLTTLSQGLSTNQSGSITEAIQSGTAQVAISTLYDSMSLKFLARGEEEYMLWGTGGSQMSHGGMDESVAPVGAWQQLDTGFKTTGNIASFGLHTLKAMYQEYIHGRIDYPMDGAEPTIDVQTGKGGFEMAQRMIAAQANNNTIVITSNNTYGQIKGAGPANLEYSPLSWSSIRVPMLATFRFIYNPAFDRTEANELTNPIIQGTGYRLSSFSMIVYPENQFGGSGNIKIVRSKENGGKVFMNVINGRSIGHPLVSQSSSVAGGVTATMSAHLGTGYEATFTKKMDGLWVVDPTRILKWVAINPYTGKYF
jgi:hypothetical protein